MYKTTPIPNSGNLSNSLFHQLRTDILQGKLKPGEKLTEQRICQEYVVSRTPVREAFQKLENDGLIETIPNRGAFVVGVSDRDIADMYVLQTGASGASELVNQSRRIKHLLGPWIFEGNTRASLF